MSASARDIARNPVKEKLARGEVVWDGRAPQGKPGRGEFLKAARFAPL